MQGKHGKAIIGMTLGAFTVEGEPWSAVVGEPWLALRVEVSKGRGEFVPWAVGA
jgi:hypothetical protein